MANKKQETYGKLKEANGRFMLGANYLSLSKYYDVKLPNGQEFNGCKIYERTFKTSEEGVMSQEDYETISFIKIKGFGLDAKLRSGLLMKVSKSMPKTRTPQQKEKIRKNKLNKLYKQRDNLDKEITNLEFG